jgi:ABC-type thiamine transport system ATPase subunit
MLGKSGQKPVLLLDEVLAELDPARRADLLNRLLASEQALLTRILVIRVVYSARQDLEHRKQNPHNAVYQLTFSVHGWLSWKNTAVRWENESYKQAFWY